MSKSDFIEEELIDPEGLEIKSKAEKIRELLEQVISSSYETFDEGEFELDDSTEAELLRDTIGELFSSLFNQQSLNVGIARHLLRRATGLRTRIILADVLKHIEFLLPVFRDVANYLVQVYDKKKPEQVGEVLRHLIVESPYRHLPYLQY
jgi:hypothetical protein